MRNDTYNTDAITSVSIQQARELDRRKLTKRSEVNDDSGSGADSYDERKMRPTSRLGIKNRVVFCVIMGLGKMHVKLILEQ